MSLKTLKDASSNAGVLSSGNTGSGWIKLSSFCSDDQIKYLNWIKKGLINMNEYKRERERHPTFIKPPKFIPVNRSYGQSSAHNSVMNLI